VIYLDHNATTPVVPRVLEKMVPFFQESWANPSSPYRFGNKARMAVEQARKRIADCVGCRPSELVFCSSGTESDNLALRGVARALRSKGNHIVTSTIEHHAVLHTCRALEKDGFAVSYAPVTTDGVTDVAALAGLLRENTILVSVMHANNETGVVQPVKEIGALAHRRGIVFHSDAVQSAGKLGGVLAEFGADLLTFSAHKFYGPKGAAVLYVRDGTPIAPATTGGAQERGLRAGTENVAAIVGLAEAVTLAFESAVDEARREAALRDRLEREIVSAIKGVRLNGARAPRVPNTSSLSFERIDGESIVLGLDVLGICVSTGSACSTGEPEPSHVLRAMGLSPQEAQGTIRVSLGRETREQHIDSVVHALTDTVARLRNISSVQPRVE
jgi:cysteine desulfurase